MEIGFGCAGGKTELLKAIKEGSIITWRHVNFYGEYDFSEEKLKDSIGFNLPEIVGWKMEEKREQEIPLKLISARDKTRQLVFCQHLRISKIFTFEWRLISNKTS